MIWPFKKEPPPPPPPAVLNYKWLKVPHASDIEWHLVVEVPILEQHPISGVFAKPGDQMQAMAKYVFRYILVSLTSGSMVLHYSEKKLALDDFNPLDGKAAGWSFMLGAIELLNANQFEGHHYPSNWIGFSQIWDVASVMQNGERVLLARSAHPHEVMLKFSNQLRMLIAPIQAAQRPNTDLHIEFFRSASKLGTHNPYALIIAPSVARKLGRPPVPEPDDEVFRLAAIMSMLREKYVEFKPPELLF